MSWKANSGNRSDRNKVRFSAAFAAFCLLVKAPCAYANDVSPWGVSPSAALSVDPTSWAGVMSAAGITTVRGYDYRRGVRGLNVYRDVGMGVTGILMWSPTEERVFPVDDLDAFRTYVRRTISEFGDYIKYWEVWNEPPNYIKNGTAEAYAKIVAAAYDTAKSVDPTVKIGLAAKSVHIQFLAATISAGARAKFDYISLHPYETASIVNHGWELPFLGIAGNVRAMLRERDPAHANVPLWFTEVGLAVDPHDGERVAEWRQAAALIKIFVLSLAQGVEHVHWFDPRDSEGLRLGLLRPDNSPRPAYRALTELAHSLGRKPKFLGFIDLPGPAYGFLFCSAGNDFVVAWPRGPQIADRSPAQASEQGAQPIFSRLGLDGTGDPSVPAPVLLRSAHKSRTSERWRRDATRSLPASWSCATRAQVASFVPGSKACGLHLVGDAQATELSLANQTTARFAVDPQFVGYADQKLEITLVARGHGQGTPGFNLKYEVRGQLDRASDNGMIGAPGWIRIEGTNPMTLKWRITNAGFVGKYGYNIAIDCDDRKHCDFSVLSLEVRKH